MMDAPHAERFWAKVDKTGDCWEWTACRKPQGYGRFKIRSYVNVPAHRVAYELTKGPIPEGLVIDHLCRNPGCVNPDHLEVVTRGENVRRGASGRMVTHCPQGHPYDEVNTYRDPKRGLRRCRTCHREQARQASANERAARKANAI